MRIVGVNLLDASEAYFDDQRATVLSNDGSTIVAIVPTGAGTGPVSVATSQGMATSETEFFVGERPEISAAEPDSGEAGTSVTIRGRNFSGAVRVSFGGHGSGPFTVLDDTTISAVIDSVSVTGPIFVTTPAATGASNFSFRVIPPEPFLKVHFATIADVNEDGDPDVVFGGVLFLGNGDGTFGQRTGPVFEGPYNVVAGSGQNVVPGASAAAIADLNRDSHPDFVALHRDASKISILLGTGGGSFEPAHDEPTGTSPTGVAVGDVDRDGVADLVVGTASGVTVHLGHGDGTFAPYVAHGRPAVTVILADLNHDGRLDVAAEGADVWAMLGSGDGTFGTPVSVPSFCRGLASAAGDVNGDGWPDLATLVCEGPVPIEHASLLDPTLLFGNGDGTFTPGPHGTPSTSDSPASNVTLADLNGDGLADLIWHGATKLQRGLYVQHASPGGGLSEPRRYWGAGGDIVAADLNHDSKPDLVVGRNVLLNDGSGGFNKHDRSWSQNQGAGLLATGDINNDRAPDLLVTQIDECCYTNTYLGRGDGTFSEGPILESSGPMAVVDINQDALFDLVVTGWPHAGVSIFLGSSDGTLGPSANYPGPGDRRPDTVSVGDQNGDGYPDAVVNWPPLGGGGNHLVGALYGTAGGEFGAIVPFEGMGVRSASPDLNGDGRPDRLSLDGEVFAWLADGGGAHQPAGGYGAAGEGGSSFMALADFNLDRRTDVAVVKYGPSYWAYDYGWVSILMNVLPTEQTTPVLASVIQAVAENGVARLVWQVSATTQNYRLYRWASGAWDFVGALTPDGTGTLTHTDPSVAPGHRYGYKLGVTDADGEVFQGDAWINVPGVVLSLEGSRPNPAIGGELTVHFVLPVAAPARIELLDLAGRRVLERVVGALGAGHHAIDLSEGQRMKPGLYFLRLTQGGNVRLARVTVLN